VLACSFSLALLCSAPLRTEAIAGDRVIVLAGNTVALLCARPFPTRTEKIRLLDSRP
jgi:hypothetical protein